MTSPPFSVYQRRAHGSIPFIRRTHHLRTVCMCRPRCNPLSHEAALVPLLRIYLLTMFAGHPLEIEQTLGRLASPSQLKELCTSAQSTNPPSPFQLPTDGWF